MRLIIFHVLDYLHFLCAWPSSLRSIFFPEVLSFVKELSILNILIHPLEYIFKVDLSYFIYGIFLLICLISFMALCHLWYF